MRERVVVYVERGDELLFDIGAERFAVDGAIKHQGRDDAICAKPSQERGGAPVSVRHGGEQALAARAATAQPRHSGGGPGLIKKNQLRRV